VTVPEIQTEQLRLRALSTADFEAYAETIDFFGGRAEIYRYPNV
jgi:hypothetical protein